MKAVTFRGVKEVRVTKEDEPKVLAPTDAVIRVTTTAICGSDLHVYHGRLGVGSGTIIGHEYVGEVAEVGAQVRTVKPGDKVFGSFHTACGICWFCRRGLFSQCVSGALFGFGERFGNLPGTQAEYARIPYADSTLFLVEDDLGEEQALFAGDTLSTAFFCAKSGNICPGDTVAVIGCGPVGLLVQMCAFVFGAARVIGIDLVPQRLQMAERLGAIPVNGSAVDPVREVKGMTGGRGADVTLEAVAARPR